MFLCELHKKLWKDKPVSISAVNRSFVDTLSSGFAQKLVIRRWEKNR